MNERVRMQSLERILDSQNNIKHWEGSRKIVTDHKELFKEKTKQTMILYLKHQ